MTIRFPRHLLWFPALLLGVIPLELAADDWPQWRGPGRDGVWRESGLTDHFQGPTLKPKWTAAIGPGFSGPTVAAARVYVTDRGRDVERVLCFSAADGKPLWTFEYPCVYRIQGGYEAGPRAAVTIHDGLAYALGAMGHLHCLDVSTGAVKWKHDLLTTHGARLPIWGMASSPIVEGDFLLLQVGGERGAGIVAFDRKTGQEAWRALEDEANYAAPITINQAGRRVTIFWTARRVAGLDPQTGRTLWEVDHPPLKMPLGVATPVLHGDKLFLTGFYDGSLLLRLPADQLRAEKVWHRRGRSERATDALHSIISTPVIHNNVVYGVDSYGEFRALSLDTGDRLWQNDNLTPHQRWSTIHMVQQADRTWMFNETGELMIVKLSPQNAQVIARAKLLESGDAQLRQRRVNWSHPAFAEKSIFARNDTQLLRADLSLQAH